MTDAEAIPRPTKRRSWLVRTIVTGALLAPSVARADVDLAPSVDGYVGAWLAVALHGERVDLATLRPASGARLSDDLRWITWSLVDGGTGTLDLNRAFTGRHPKRVLLSSVLALSEPLDGLALVSVDGSARLVIDGNSVWTRSTPHARGRAWDPVPLTLARGDHVVALDLEPSGPTWNVDVRLLEASNLEPPEHAIFRLPGVSREDSERLAARLARVDVGAGLVPWGYQPRIRVEFPRGAPSTPSVELTASLGKGKELVAATLSLGKLPVGRRGVDAVEAMFAPPATSELGNPSSLPTTATLRVGSESSTVHVTFDPEAPSAFRAALELEGALAARRVASDDPDVARATLERTLTDLGSRLDAGDPTEGLVRRRLSDFVASYVAGKDPLRAPGVLDLARPSSLDGAPDAFELHVPAGFRSDAATRYPLVVLLHGYDGTPERIMTAFLGTDSKRPRAGISGFILAPAAHGNAFYRGPGETEAMSAIDWVLEHYPIDPDRVSIAGHSMGGTGATELAFRHPDRFAAISSLAGYHSYFVRRDVLGRPLRAWEWAELVRYSPAAWADNGRHMPLYVAQGTRDLPLAHSEVLVDRYRALGYSVVAEWPEIGHDVWRIAWDAGKQWPTLAARSIKRNPKHVTLKTDSLRSPRQSWVEIVELERPGFPGSIDAKVDAPDRIVVTESLVNAFRLERPLPHVAGGSRVTVVVNGTDLVFDGSARLEAHRGPSGWLPGPPSPLSGLSKRAGIEGPIRDAFEGPLAFVYGTLDPRQERAAREVAEHFRARYSGDARFPVLADVSVPASLGATHSLFLVGSNATNRVLRSLDARLPIGMTKGGVRLGGKIVTGDAEIGAACIYPNPENPSRYVVVVEAADTRGLYRSMSLPLQLPDFVVFDSGVAAAAGQQVLGDARVLAAGYFDRTWALPNDVADVIAVPAGRDPVHWNPG